MRSLNIQLVLVLTAFACAAQAGSTADQDKAFNEGKSYRSRNAEATNSINSENASKVPGQNAQGANDYSSMYGKDTKSAGSNTASTCATQPADKNGYKDQHCQAVNYVRKNPSENQNYEIDENRDATVQRSEAVNSNPRAYTGNAGGLAGNYTACTTRTTNTESETGTARCQIGHEVTENVCSANLIVSYTWEAYSGQTGADARYAKCQRQGDVRGDKLTIPQQVSYSYEVVACADYGLGEGQARIAWRHDCQGNRTMHGYNTTSCATQLDPALFWPSQPFDSCTTKPRTWANCFTATGEFTESALVPVFRDTVDDSSCIELNKNRAVIK